MSQLPPDPSTLEKFVCQGYGDADPFFVENPEPTPRRIDEYVIDPELWKNALPANQRTVEGVLGQTVEQYKCIFCWNRGRQCFGEPCWSWWRVKRPRTAANTELRDTGGPMGLGVFATQLIRAGGWLDDYVGELMPFDCWFPDDLYAFDIPGIARCTSQQYGNWTRFVNHHCTPNVQANDWMVGQRVVMVFRANRDIRPGEQLFIQYGRQYFESAKRFCKCDAFPEDHFPPPFDVPTEDLPSSSDDSGTPEQEQEQGREAEADAEDNTSLLQNLSLEPSAIPGQDDATEPLRQQPKTPRRQVGVEERPGWTHPERDVSPEDFFLSVQRALWTRSRTPQRGSRDREDAILGTPQRSGRIQTPRAPRPRRFRRCTP